MKNRRILSHICLLLAIVMVMGSLTGCGKREGSGQTSIGTSATAAAVQEASEDASTASSDEPSWKSDNSPFKFDWFINVSWLKWAGDYGNDWLSKTFKEKTGAEINFITPASDDGQQLATMIASDSLPEVVSVETWLDGKTKIAKAGYAYAINDLVDEYAPTFNKILFKDVMGWFAEADGKTYGIPCWAYSKDELKPGEKLITNACWTIREDLWEKIGKPDMSTPEGFLAACDKIKNEVKQYNEKNVIPFQIYDFNDCGNLAVRWMFQYFGIPFEDESGRLIGSIVDGSPIYNAKFFDVIKFLNTATQKGLISLDNFSEKRDQINEKVAAGRVFSYLMAPQDMNLQMENLMRNDEKARYIPLKMHGYDGAEPYVSDISGMGWLLAMITKNAKQPDRIIKFFEYLYSMEGQMDCFYGKEGVNYNMESGKIVKTPQMIEDEKNNVAAKKYSLGFGMMGDYLKWKDLMPPLGDPIMQYVENKLKNPTTEYSANFTALGGKEDSRQGRNVLGKTACQNDTG